jgi:hypothetical protein
MSLKRIFSLSLLLLLGLALYGVNENAGTTGFNNLKIVYSARAMGMAKALTGIDGTLDALQFNPAGILNVEGKTVSSTFCSYLVGSNAGAIHALYQKSDKTTYGLLLHYLNLGEMDRTEVTIHNEYVETGETFGASDIILGASLARKINSMIDLGITLKYIRDNIDSYSASALVLDGGLVHHPLNEKITVGVSVRNLGRQLTYYTGDKVAEGLPFTFAAGLSYQLRHNLLAAVDISKVKGANMNVKAGLEAQLHPMLTLRAGYNNNASDWKTGGDWEWASGLTCGAGFNWKDFGLDYGLASYGNLGFVNQVSLSYNF